MSIKVSVIVPVYNPPENYLRECLDSICNQTLKDIEIILIDNAATGNNPQILQEYAAQDKRIKLFRFEKNQGFSSAIKQGLLLAQGEYVHFMDSDDLIKSNAYETLYNTAKKNELEILIFFYDWYDVQTNSIKIHNIPLQDEAPFSFAKNSHRLNKFLTLWNKIIKKDFIFNNQVLFDPQLTLAAGDVIVSATAYISAQKIAYTNDKFYIWRINQPTSVMNTIRSKNNEIFIFAKDIISYIKNNKLTDEQVSYLLNLTLCILSDNYIKSKSKLKYFCRLKIFSYKNYKLFKKHKKSLSNFHFIQEIKKSSFLKTITKIAFNLAGVKQ